VEEMAKLTRLKKPLICPEEFLKGQGVDIRRHEFRKALLAFMSISGMGDRFNGKPAPAPVFSHTREHPLIRDDGAILVGQVYGGPYCSIVLEELSVFGVRYAIGYGFSGTLDGDVAPGSIMVAESGFCSDGTSKQYTGESETSADEDMLDSLQSVIRGHGIRPELGKVWTTDALYREFPSKVAYWKRKGARFVNLETAPFYAVAKAKGIKAVYLSVVSDTVDREKWSGWSADLEKAVDKMWDISLEVVQSL
jgi:uridine phosphorylase